MIVKLSLFSKNGISKKFFDRWNGENINIAYDRRFGFVELSEAVTVKYLTEEETKRDKMRDLAEFCMGEYEVIVVNNIIHSVRSSTVSFKRLWGQSKCSI